MKSLQHPRVQRLLILALALSLTATSCRKTGNDDAERERQEQLRKQKEEEARKQAEAKQREEAARQANSIAFSGTARKVVFAGFFNNQFGATKPNNLVLLPSLPTGDGKGMSQEEYLYLSVPSDLSGKEIDLFAQGTTPPTWLIRYKRKGMTEAISFSPQAETRPKKGSTLTLTKKDDKLQLFTIKLHLIYDDADKKEQSIDANYEGVFAVGGLGIFGADDLREYKASEPKSLTYNATYVKSALRSKEAQEKKLTQLILLPATASQADFRQLPEGLSIRLPETLLGEEIPLTVDNTAEQDQDKAWAIAFVKDGDMREFFGNTGLPKLLEGSKLRVDDLGAGKYKVTATLILPHKSTLYTINCTYEGTFAEVASGEKLK